MTRHHLDDLRQALSDSAWTVEEVHTNASKHVCGSWDLHHASGARRRLEFTTGSQGTTRFEDSSGCHFENDKSRYAYFSEVGYQWKAALKQLLDGMENCSRNT